MTTQLPPDDRDWKEFLQKHRPQPPEAAPESEDKLMSAIELQQQPVININKRLWALSPAIAASLLMVWGSYRTISTLPDAHLEAFLENNWNNLVGEVPVKSPNNNPEADWMVLANSAQ
ncbi:MAG: hypothetical protein F6K58_14940 [Symploca sp. SIO2E9]|nr:hypothetical protein [Symploca sp. SIO2E9]